MTNKPTQVASMVITKANSPYSLYQSEIAANNVKLKIYNADRGALLKESSRIIMELLK